MKKCLAFFISFFVVSNLTAFNMPNYPYYYGTPINWIHNVYNNTDGTVLVNLDTVFGTQATDSLQPQESKNFEVSIFCITDVVVEGKTGSIAGRRASFHVPIERNVCKGHNYEVNKVGDTLQIVLTK